MKQKDLILSEHIELDKKLGAGFFAAVYLGHWQPRKDRPIREVALKFVPQEAVKDMLSEATDTGHLDGTTF